MHLQVLFRLLHRGRMCLVLSLWAAEGDSRIYDPMGKRGGNGATNTRKRGGGGGGGNIDGWDRGGYGRRGRGKVGSRKGGGRNYISADASPSPSRKIELEGKGIKCDFPFSLLKHSLPSRAAISQMSLLAFVSFQDVRCSVGLSWGREH